jgi:hypothetical protein
MDTTGATGPSNATTRMAGFSSAFKSSAVVGILCYLLVNIVLNLIWADSELPLLDVLLSQNTEAFSLITRAKQECKVVLLGSSVMERPFSDYSAREPHYTSEPTLLEKALWKKSSSYVPAINYCVEASLVSDQYILLKKYILNRPQKPVIVLGLAPRDFCDSRWPYVTDTTTFKTLITPKDTDIWPFYIRNSNQLLQFFSSHVSLLFRFRRPICSLLSETIQVFVLEPFLGHIHSDKDPAAALGGLGQLLSSKTPTNGPNVHTQSIKPLEERFRSSYMEYVRVYSNLKETDMYRIQFDFLKRLLDLCQAKNCQLIIVNIPVASTNKSLLPLGFYEKYLANLRTLIAPYNNVTFVDAPNLITFNDDQDFWDAAHLNDKGGQKLTELICPPVLKLLSESRAPSRLKLGLNGN